MFLRNETADLFEFAAPDMLIGAFEASVVQMRELCPPAPCLNDDAMAL